LILYKGKGGGTYGSVSSVAIEGKSVCLVELFGIINNGVLVGSSGGGRNSGAGGGAVIFRAPVIRIRNAVINCVGGDGAQDSATSGRYSGGGSGKLHHFKLNVNSLFLKEVEF
jgi:hypothetical protein